MGDDALREIYTRGVDTTVAFERNGRMWDSDEALDANKMTSPSKRMVVVEE